MRAGDRIVAWTRVAFSFLSWLAVVTFPLRPPATHQAPNLLRKNLPFAPKPRVRITSPHVLSGVLASMRTGGLWEGARWEMGLKAGSTWPTHGIGAQCGQTLRASGLVSALTSLRC